MERFGKALAAIEDNPDKDYGPNGGFTAVLSTPSLDRDGDRLEREEWQEPLPDRLPLDIDHGMTVADTVGSFVPYFDEAGRLLMDAYFASTPKAQDARTLVNEGHIRSVSVAFMTDKSKKAGEPRREILNAGIVAIPSNRDAQILDSKALDQRAVELALVSDVKAALSPGGGGDAALTQAIHDASVHLGAICIQMVPDVDPTGTSDGANKDVDTAEVDIKEADEVETDSAATEPATIGSMTWEQFKTAFAEVLTPQADSPVEPVTETATASEEEPVPVEEVADEAADDEVDPQDRAREMAMSLSATHQFTL